MYKEALLPQIFNSQAHVIVAEIDRALDTIKAKPLVNPERPNSIRISLLDYQEEMNKGEINIFMERYRKQNAVKPAGNFALVSAYGHSGRKEVINTGTFILDGVYSIILGFQPVDETVPLLFAAGSIIFPEDKKIWLGGSKENQRIYTDNSYPVISQLQGSSDWNYKDENKYHQAQAITGSYKFERALIGLFIDWAIRQQLAGLYQIPAEYNYYFYDTGDSDRKKRMKMRYNISGKRMGFRPVENGLLGLSLVF